MKIYISDIKDYEKIQGYEDWQLNALLMNCNYTFWGNNQDYMCANGIWNSPVEFDNIDQLWVLDDYNELINFYFELYNDNGKAKLALQMWMIHPSKGASRGYI